MGAAPDRDRYRGGRCSRRRAAVTRRQTANKADRVYTPTMAARPGELVLAVDIATRTIGAGVLRPVGAKAVDAALILARMMVPEPMRPGWDQALAMSASRIPHQRLVPLDARMALAAAKPVIVPDTVVIGWLRYIPAELAPLAVVRHQPGD